MTVPVGRTPPLAVEPRLVAVGRRRSMPARRREGAEGEGKDPVTPEFPRVTAHDPRHTAASLAVSSGANVKAIQKMLGHTSAAMTLDVYADLFDDDLEDVADRMDTAVGKMWAEGTKPTRAAREKLA